MLRNWALLLVLCWLPSLRADYVYQGTIYNPPAYNNTGEVCTYPIEATSALTCPRQLYADTQAGSPIVFLDDPGPPPNVYATVSLLQFEGIDQALLTFTIRFNVFLAWQDNRSYSQIQVATAAANRTGKCGKYCSKSTLSGSVGDCCDGIWLPTLQFLGTKAASFVEEDYIVVSQGPDYPVVENRNTTVYLLKASTTVNQGFDFSDFPFDKHALSTRMLCMDCRLSAVPGSEASFATYRFKTSTDSEGTLIDGRDVPPSSGWQLNSVDLAFVNVSTDTLYGGSTAAASVAAYSASEELSGMVFILRVERVTRLYYALQTILPAVILVLIGFAVFFVDQDNFGMRFGMLVSLLFPTFITQFTVSTLLPKTYTVLSPQLLAFVSLLELALLLSINCATHVILNRKEYVAWRLSMAKDKNLYTEQEVWLLEGKEAGKEDKEQELGGDEEDPKLKDNKSFRSASEQISRPEDDEAEEKEKDKEKKAHDEGVRQIALQTQKWGPRWLRKLRLWYTSLALHDSKGRRNRVACLFERWALSIAFLVYIGMILGIFLPKSEGGRNGDQA